MLRSAEEAYLYTAAAAEANALQALTFTKEGALCFPQMAERGGGGKTSKDSLVGRFFTPDRCSYY